MVIFSSLLLWNHLPVKTWEADALSTFGSWLLFDKACSWSWLKPGPARSYTAIGLDCQEGTDTLSSCFLSGLSLNYSKC